MKILFTGGSSFTGYWFVNHLLNKGYSVSSTFTKKKIDDYNGIRKVRVQKLLDKVISIFDVRFGDEKFLDLIDKGNFNLICHHGADVLDYRSLNFNVSSAFNKNTHNILQVLNLLRNSNSKFLITGSVFEGREGLGSRNSLAFSPYGLSKQFTSEAFEYYCNSLGVPLAKFVIPNPFGPFEEERFTSFLVKSWIKGEIPIVKTPLYVRDNIHISLLASCFEKFCVEFINSNLMYYKINPSGYVESQEQFTKRFSEEISKRIKIKTPFELSNQTDFNEPLIKINNSPATLYFKDWSEQEAWDELAEYYQLYYLQNE